MSIAENIAQVKANIERAAIAAGRDPKEILLVGATKMNDADRVREAVAAGLPCCGENRVQELLEKNEAGAYAGADLHFIGTLQKNKAKYLVGLVSLIHSVDSVELMKEISRQAEKRGIRQDILLEVNTGGEASKSGFAPEALPQALERAGDFRFAECRRRISHISIFCDSFLLTIAKKNTIMYAWILCLWA